MKKIIAIVALLLSTSAFAQHGHYGHQGHQSHRYHGGGGSGKWVAPLIGGVLLGAIISDARANQQVPQTPVIVQQFPIYQPNTFSCLVQVYDPITNTLRNEVMTCVNR